MKENKTFYVLSVKFDDKKVEKLGKALDKTSSAITDDELKKIILDLSKFDSVEMVTVDEKLAVSESRPIRLQDIPKSLGGSSVVTPLSCDRIALQHALKKQAVDADIDWISGSRIMRRLNTLYPGRYEKYRDNAYKTEKLAELSGIKFKGNGISKSFAEILCRILERESVPLKTLWRKVKKDLKKTEGTEAIKSETMDIERPGAPNGPFSGKSIKFSGKIAKGIKKLDGAHWAAGLGFNVFDKNKVVTVLVKATPTNPKQQKEGTRKENSKKHDHMITSEQFLDLVNSKLKAYKGIEAA